MKREIPTWVYGTLLYESELLNRPRRVPWKQVFGFAALTALLLLGGLLK